MPHTPGDQRTSAIRGRPHAEDLIARRPWAAATWALRGAYSDETLRLTIGVFGQLERWCEARELTCLPVTADTLAAYLSEFFRGRARNTVRNMLYAVRKVHVANGHDDPTQARDVRLAYRAACRTSAVEPRQARGINAAERDQLVAACPDTLLGLRDRAMISLGYDTLCRRSELVALRIEDLVLDGERGAVIRVRRAKNDPFAMGQNAFISRRGMVHVNRWLAAVGRAEGPLLRPVVRDQIYERSLNCNAVARRLHDVGKLAGFTQAQFARLTSHSMRVGAAQDLVVAGRTLMEVMRAGRWRQVDSVARYVRHAPVNVWANEEGVAEAVGRGLTPDPG